MLVTAAEPGANESTDTRSDVRAECELLATLDDSDLVIPKF